MYNQILESLKKFINHIDKLNMEQRNIKNLKEDISNIRKYKNKIDEFNKNINIGSKEKETFNQNYLNELKKTFLDSYKEVTTNIITIKNHGVYIDIRRRDTIKKIGLIINKLKKCGDLQQFKIIYRKNAKILSNLFYSFNKELSNLNNEKSEFKTLINYNSIIAYKIIKTGLNNLNNSIDFENTIEINDFNPWSKGEIDLATIDKYIKNLTKKNKYNISIYLCLKTFYLYSNNIEYRKRNLFETYKVLDIIILLKIAKILIYIFLKTENIKAIAELYDIDIIIYNDVEITENVLNYYIQNKDFYNSKKILEHLIEIEPYHQSIKTYSFEIQKLKAYDKIKSTSTIQIDNLNELSGIEFEELIKNQFIKLGFRAETTKKSGDYGADLTIETKNKTRIVVQCKRFKSKVNLKAIQEVVGAISFYGCDTGIVITNSTFFKSAINLSESNEIELWDHSKLLLFFSGDLSFSELKNF